jgi:hypothetical protein
MRGCIDGGMGDANKWANALVKRSVGGVAVVKRVIFRATGIARAKS